MADTINNTGRLYFQQAIAQAPPPPPEAPEAPPAPAPEPVITKDMFVAGEAVPGVSPDSTVADLVFDQYDRDGNGMNEAEFLEYYEEVGRGNALDAVLDAELEYTEAKVKVDTMNQEIAAAASQLDPTATDEERKAFVEWYKEQPEYQAAVAELDASTATLERELLQARPILEEMFLDPEDPLNGRIPGSQDRIMEAMTELADAGQPGVAIDFAETLLASPELDPDTATQLIEQVLAPAVQAQVALQAAETGDVDGAIAEAETLLQRVTAAYGAPEQFPEVYDTLKSFSESLSALRQELAAIDPARADDALSMVEGFQERFKAFGVFDKGMTVLGTVLTGLKLKDAMQDGDYAQALVEASGLAPDVAGFSAKIMRVVGHGGAITKAMPLISLVAGSVSLVKNLADGKLLAAMGDALIVASPFLGPALGPLSAVLGVGLNVVSTALESDEPAYLQKARDDYARYLQEQGLSPETATAFAEADRERGEQLMAATGLSAEQITSLLDAGVNVLDPERIDFYSDFMLNVFASPGGAVDSAAAYDFLMRLADGTATGQVSPDRLYEAMEEVRTLVDGARLYLANTGRTAPYSDADWDEALEYLKVSGNFRDHEDTAYLMDLLIASGG